MNNYLKNQKGISLITLIITIIAILIIAIISIRQGLVSLRSTQDSVIETNLKMVQQKVLEEYAKTNVANSGNPDSIKIFAGEKQTTADLNALRSEEPINLRSLGDPDALYYILDTDVLQSLGLEMGDNQEYLVNYRDGEVWDLTNRKYEDGTYAYLGGNLNDEINVEENFLDATISVDIKTDWVCPYGGSQYKVILTIKDDFYRISEDDKVGNTLNMDDYTGNKIKITVNDNVVPINNIVFSDTSNENEYQAEITVAKNELESQLSVDGDGIIKITILPNAIIDSEKGTNDKVELTSTINIGPTHLSIHYGLSNTVQYETKTSKFPNGYTDQNSIVWGTGARVNLILSEPNGFRDNDYVFDYVWKSDGSVPNDYEYDDHITVHTNRGDTSTTSIIYLNSGSGKGKLYIKPSNSWYSGDTFIPENTVVSVNLDNTPPMFVSMINDLIADSHGILGAKRVDVGLMDSSPSILSSNSPLVKIVDEDSGIMQYLEIPGDGSDYVNGLYQLGVNDYIAYCQTWSKDNQNVPNKFGELSSFGWSRDYGFHGAIRTDNSHYDIDTVTFNYRGPDDDYSTSGDYYCWQYEYERDLYVGSQEEEITDSVGNALVQPWCSDPISLDLWEPQLTTNIEYNNNGDLVASLSFKDDFSGLSKDNDVLKKIKYKWLKDTNNYDQNNMTELNSNITSITYSDRNVFGEDNQMTFRLTAPSDDYIALLVVVDGYEDIAKNPIFDEQLLEASITYSSVKVEIREMNQYGEYDKTGYPISLEVKVKAINQDGTDNPTGWFTVNNVKFGHVGLNDVIDIPDDGTTRHMGEYIIPNITVNMNGPVFISFDTQNGNMSQNYTVKYVQETILHIDLSKINSTTYYLPFCYQSPYDGSHHDVIDELEYRSYSDFPTNIEGAKMDNPIYVDWGDGTANYVDKYALTSWRWKNFDEFDANDESDGKKIFMWVGTYNSPNSSSHTYSNIGTDGYDIKISGVIPTWVTNLKIDSLYDANCFSYSFDSQTNTGEYSYCEYQKEPNNVETDPIKTEDSERISYYSHVEFNSWKKFDNYMRYDKAYIENLNNSKYAIVQVKQFGIHYELSAEDHVDFKNRMLYGCINLESMPYISGINQDAFEYAENLDFVFAYCINLENISSDLFKKNKKCSSFRNTFYYCLSIDDVPSGLFDFTFEETDKYVTFSYSRTFAYCSNLTTLHNNLFNTVQLDRGDYKFEETFSHCDLLSINNVPNLFANINLNPSFEKTFEYCENIHKIPSNLFNKNTNATSFYGVFSNCVNLEEIPKDLFSTNENATTFSNAFEVCRNITSIPVELFSNCKNAKFFKSTFSNCIKIESIDVDLFKYNPLAESFDSTFLATGIKSVPRGLFYNNPKINNMSATFCNCKNLLGIEETPIIQGTSEFGPLIPKTNNLNTANSCFKECSNLEKIPETLFKDCTKLTDVGFAFKGCIAVNRIPDLLFIDCPNINNFSSTFSETSIKSIPDGLFEQSMTNENVGKIKFSNTFEVCESLRS